jgi:NMD protein affecting ribosome stability and mRNA decay
MARRFCPKCGKLFSEGEKYYENYYCSKCYVRNDKEFTLPASLTLNSCHTCRAYSVTIDGEISAWDYFRPDEEELFDFIADLIYRRVLKRIENETGMVLGLDMDESDLVFDSNRTFMVKILSGVTDKMQGLEKELQIYIKKIYCDSCAAQKGGLFDAVIQVRVFDQKDYDRLDDIMRILGEHDAIIHEENRNSFVSQVDTVTNGYDLKISTKQYAKNIVSWLKNKYPMHLNVSKKLMGVERMTGGDFYRIYFTLILLPVVVGDILEIGGVKHKVMSLRNNNVKLRNLEHDKIKVFKFDWFTKNKYVVRKGDSPDDE